MAVIDCWINFYVTASDEWTSLNGAPQGRQRISEIRRIIDRLPVSCDIQRHHVDHLRLALRQHPCHTLQELEDRALG